jgi:hypothetical protein
VRRKKAGTKKITKREKYEKKAAYGDSKQAIQKRRSIKRLG